MSDVSTPLVPQHRRWLKAVASLNISLKDVAAEVSQSVRPAACVLKLLACLNMYWKFVPDEVSHPEMSPSKLSADMNICWKFVPAEVSQPEMSPLKLFAK